MIDIQDDGIERITVLAKEFMPAAMEYHRREMGKQGFSLAGPIVKRKYFMIEGEVGAPTALFDGEAYYAATFTRQKPAE